MGVCIINGCNKKIDDKYKYCYEHFVLKNHFPVWIRSHGSTPPSPVNNKKRVFKKCMLDGCGDKALRQSRCNKHYMAWRRMHEKNNKEDTKE